MGVRPIPKPASPRALVLAPHGRDARVAEQLLNDAAIPSTICSNLNELQACLGADALFVVCAEEALRLAELKHLSRAVEAQPPWSDLPFIILTHHAAHANFREMGRFSALLSNVTLIERPFHAQTFLSVAKTAFKGRMRQYEARALIEELRASEEELERRVAQRTVELQKAHTDILEEIASRERAEDKLRQSQKMEMIGQLTGGVAHDFNNLLMAVIGNLDLLRRRLPDDSATLRLIEGATQGAQRGAALTQRLLAFARRQDLHVEPVDLAALLHGMSDLIRRSIGASVELVIAFDRAVPAVLVDANQVELAILNLVVNARDAMPNGGRVTIGVDRGAPGELLEGSHWVRLTVADTGSGMDDETLRKATEPFFSTKELGKGTGLGLSMVHGLARQLGGAFRLTSRLGKGTSAELWFPSTTLPVKTSAPSPQAASHLPDSKLTVLVVDDDALISMSTALMVEDLGHEVVEVNSGNDALEILKGGRRIDLLITDFSMPKMNGAELARAARKICPKLPVLVATGFAELPDGVELGLQRIGKPYQQEQLAEAVAGALRVQA